MKTLTIPFLILLVFSLSNCQEYSLDQETLDQIDSATARHYNLLEAFDASEDWVGYAYSFEPGGYYVEVDANQFISEGSLKMSAVQGTDCDGEKVELAFDTKEEFIALMENEEDLHIEIKLGYATTQALGSNLFVYHLGYTTTRVYFEYLEEPMIFEFVMNKGEIVEAYGNGEPTTEYWLSSTTSSIPNYKFVFESRACGPDLYAGAEMEIDRFSIFRTRD